MSKPRGMEPDAKKEGKSSGPFAYVARQPILDSNNQVHGYELLYRSSPLNRFPAIDQETASGAVMDQAVALFGLDRLVPHDTRAFLNLTERVLTDGLYRVLPPDRVVLELLEDIPVTPETLDACDEAIAHGYTLALDDYALEPARAPLVTRARIIKLEWPMVKVLPRLAAAVQALNAAGHLVLAEKVEDQAEWKGALHAGCALFQGFYLYRPEMLQTRDVPANKLLCVQLLRTVSQPGFRLDEVEGLLRQEPSLSMRLLRYLNSAAFSLRGEVTSLRQALILLGEQPLKTWVRVMVLSQLGDDRPRELITRSLSRARCCELVGRAMQAGTEDDVFLLGLISLLDVMLGRPLPELLMRTGVGQPLRRALLAGDGVPGRIFAATLDLEHGAFGALSAHATALGVPELLLAAAYQEAVQWADGVVAAW